MPDEPAVELAPGAAEFVRAKGGSAYVWIDGAGMRHVRHVPPAVLDRSLGFWQEFEVEGIRLFVDRAIDPPRKWVVVLRHFPHRRVDVLYNGDTPAAASVGMGAWH